MRAMRRMLRPAFPENTPRSAKASAAADFRASRPAPLKEKLKRRCNRLQENLERRCNIPAQSLEVPCGIRRETSRGAPRSFRRGSRFAAAGSRRARIFYP
jgi:hypothetical protein